MPDLPPPIPEIRRPAENYRAALAKPTLEHRGATISGTAEPGSIVEVINLSRAPAFFLRLEDTFVAGKTDADGKFTGRLPDIIERDMMRLRVRTPKGAVSPWVAFQINGTGGFDSRAAYVALNRVRPVLGEDGMVTFVHHTRSPFTEPSANLRFTNTRTLKSVDTTATETGSLPEDVRLEAKAGDKISVAVSDGAGNRDLSATVGSFSVTASTGKKTPDARASDRGLSLEKYDAPLFVDDVSYQDVAQGAIGNCYVPGATAAIAFASPEAIKDAIRKKGDDHYEVRFYKVDEHGIVGDPTWVEVDAKLFKKNDRLVYGKVPNGRDAEAWFPLLEKAYAVHRGTYDTIESGGIGRLFSEILGRPNRPMFLDKDDVTADQLWTKLVVGLEERRALAFGTYPKAKAGERYRGADLISDHAYAVVGLEEKEGQRYVMLLNPWANGGNTGKNDGVYRVKLEDLLRLAEVLNDC